MSSREARDRRARDSLDQLTERGQSEDHVLRCCVSVHHRCARTLHASLPIHTSSFYNGSLRLPAACIAFMLCPAGPRNSMS